MTARLKPTTVSAFLNSIEPKQKRADAKKIAAIMKKATEKRAALYGNVVGYGKYHYKYARGRDGDGALIAFSPRAQSFSIYIMPGFKPFSSLMKKLGKHKHGSCCLYINKLADVDEKILQELMVESVKLMRKRYNVR